MILNVCYIPYVFTFRKKGILVVLIFAFCFYFILFWMWTSARVKSEGDDILSRDSDGGYYVMSLVVFVLQSPPTVQNISKESRGAAMRPLFTFFIFYFSWWAGC